jgi:hypothetical protein
MTSTSSTLAAYAISRSKQRYRTNDSRAVRRQRRAFADALGHPVEAIAVPRAEWETLWVSQGMPEGRTAPRAEMVDGFNSGWIHFGVPEQSMWMGRRASFGDNSARD